jgi:hypothetical protein
MSTKQSSKEIFISSIQLYIASSRGCIVYCTNPKKSAIWSSKLWTLTQLLDINHTHIAAEGMLTLFGDVGDKFGAADLGGHGGPCS